MVEPGNCVPLGLVPMGRWIEVVAGEVLRGEELVILAGSTHLLPGGWPSGCINTGTDTAQVWITAPADGAPTPG